jgi:hypothetical protein
MVYFHTKIPILVFLMEHLAFNGNLNKQWQFGIINGQLEILIAIWYN